MPGRRYELRAASEARQPIVVAFSDGREYTFPGDVSADAWLTLFEGEYLTGDVVPMKLVEPMYRLIVGEEQFDALRKELTWSELQQTAWTLFWAYVGGEKKEADDAVEDSANPQ